MIGNGRRVVKRTEILRFEVILDCFEELFGISYDFLYSNLDLNGYVVLPLMSLIG